MQTRRRATGVNVLGELAWGSHVCVFYQTKQDLLDVLLPYFSAGLDTGEACAWIVSGPLTVTDAEAALREERPHFDREVGRGAIEILDGAAWYVDQGRVDWQRLIHASEAKLQAALDRGF